MHDIAWAKSENGNEKNRKKTRSGGTCLWHTDGRRRNGARIGGNHASGRNDYHI